MGKAGGGGGGEEGRWRKKKGWWCGRTDSPLGGVEDGGCGEEKAKVFNRRRWMVGPAVGVVVVVVGSCLLRRHEHDRCRVATGGIHEIGWLMQEIRNY